MLTFRYKKLELRKKDWRTYIKSYNPVACSFNEQNGIHRKRKSTSKNSILTNASAYEVSNPAQSELVNGFFESYLILRKTRGGSARETHQPTR